MIFDSPEANQRLSDTAAEAPPATFMERFQAADKQGQLRGTVLSPGFAVSEDYDRRIKDIKDAGLGDLSDLNPMWNSKPTQRAPHVYSEGHSIYDMEPSKAVEDPHEAFQKKLEQLQKDNPDKAHIIKADKPITGSESYQAAKKAAENAASAYGGPPLTGPIADFAGGMWSMRKDPFQIGTLVIGPMSPVRQGAKAVLTMGLKQAAANAAVEASLQPFVQSWRKSMNDSYGWWAAAEEIGMAGAFGLGADAGVRMLYRGAQARMGRKAVLDEQGRVVGYESGAKAAEREALNARNLEIQKNLEALPKDTLDKVAQGDEEATIALAKALKADEDPSVGGAINALRNTDRVTLDGIDDGWRERSLLQQFRALEDPSEPAPVHFDAATKAERPRLADDAELPRGTEGNQHYRMLDLDGKPVRFEAVDANRITTDPATFQFKGGRDSAGASNALRAVDFDGRYKGKVIVYEREDGSLVVADGHDRVSLANRAPEPQKLNALVFREKDGWTAEQVRAEAARKNIQEGTGSLMDVAGAIRRHPEIVDDSMAVGTDFMADARSIARLSDEAFDAVAGGQFNPKHGVLVSDHVPDQSRHMEVLRELDRRNPPTEAAARREIGNMLREPANMETLTRVMDIPLAEPHVIEARNDVLAGVMTTLRQEPGYIGEIETQAIAAVIRRLAEKPGLVSDTLAQAGRAVAEGQPLERAIDATLRRFEDVIGKAGVKGLADQPVRLSPTDERPRFLAALAGSDAAVGRSMRAKFAENLRQALDEATTPPPGRLDDPIKDAPKQVERLREDLAEDIAVAMGQPSPAQLAALQAYRAGRSVMEPSNLWFWQKPEPSGTALMFHATNRGFDKFDLGQSADFGIHFGTAKQAATRLSDTNRLEGGRTIPAEVTVRNAIAMDDQGFWGPVGMATELQKQGYKVTAEEWKRFTELGDAIDQADADVQRIGNSVKPRLKKAVNEANDAIKAKLNELGIDGIWYKNTAEGRGWSLIVWNEGQVKSATTGEQLFSRPQTSANPDILAMYERYVTQEREALDAVMPGTGRMIDEFVQANPEVVERIAEALGAPTGRPQAAQMLEQAMPQFTNPRIIDMSKPVLLTPEANARMPDIRRELDRTVQMLPPEYRIRVEDSLVFNFGDGDKRLDGLHDGYEKLIYVSMAAGDPVRTSRHEVIHALRQSGLMKDEEFAALYKFADRLGLRKAYEIDTQYKAPYTEAYGNRGADFVEQLLREETVANMFSDYSLNGRRFGDVAGGGMVDRLIDMIVTFMKQVRDIMGGYGFRNVYDVFESIESGAMARRGMGGAPGDTMLAAFAGTKATTANIPLLVQAERMAQRGRPDREIHKATGWFRGPDKKWRFEIDDSQSKVVGLDKAKPWTNRPKGAPTEQGIDILKGVPLGDVFKHDLLYKAYPFLEKMRVTVLTGAGLPDKLNGTGEFVTLKKANEPGKTYITMVVRGRTDAEIHEAMLHEIQHYIQRKEGFDRGSNPDNFATGTATGKTRYGDRNLFPLTPGEQQVSRHLQILDNFNDDGLRNGRGVNQQMLEGVMQTANVDAAKALRIGESGYKKSAGEAEANLTMSRQLFDVEQRRALYPGDFYPKDLEGAPQQFANWRDALSASDDALKRTAALRRKFYEPRKIGEKTTIEGMPDINKVENRWSAKYGDKAMIDLTEHGYNATFEISKSVRGWNDLTNAERTAFVNDVETYLRSQNKRMVVETTSMDIDEASWWWQRDRNAGSNDPRMFVSDVEDELMRKHNTTDISVHEGNGYGEDWSVTINGKRSDLDPWDYIHQAQKRRGEMSADDEARKYGNLDKAIIEDMRRFDNAPLARDLADVQRDRDAADLVGACRA